ncbi:hypothetical protein CARUB_v10013509mg [Capsella rubella]|uniref:Uncharacterized protein n=1 Tax=Capsella rubella TaxID=81985 RepID=R0HL02_9BRAS|nr:scarecrow-like protein 15 [Capsella rubella]EOA30389.1 hypothetical protein CARUB_v10013509mg [Capsella rubella]
MRAPASSDNTNSNSNLICYNNEPTSVLDLRRSPSPATAEEKPVGNNNTNQFPIEDDHHHHHVMRSMDWDSIMKELELDDDSTPTLKSNFPTFAISPPLPVFPDQFHPPEFPGHGHGFIDNNNEGGGGFDFVEDLIRVVNCVDSDELQLAQVILSRLNQRLRSPTGRPLERAAFYFKEALGSLITGTNRNQNRLSSWSEIVQKIRAVKEFSGVSPIPLFSHFTANQTILDSLTVRSSSPPYAHVVDFEIGFGGQYASLMREIAEKSVNGIGFLRVTAVVTEDSAVETRLVKENLAQFAADLKIRFQIEFVLMRTFEVLSFKAVRFVEGERTVVLLSPVIFRRLNGISGFVNDLRRVSPKVVVFVDSEGWTGISGGAGSFQREFVSGLEFYTMVFESLDAAVASPGGGDLVKKIIEAFVLRPKIASAVEAGADKRGGEMMTWREAFCAAGMRMVPLSQFVDFQAECLVEKAQVRGFHVAKRQGELMLCWHERSLVATSAWRFY